MRMNARRTKPLVQRRLMRAQRALSREAAAVATKVVVHTTNRGGWRSRRRIVAPTLRDGAWPALALALGSPMAPCHLLRLASRHHPRQATRRARAGVVQRFLR